MPSVQFIHSAVVDASASEVWTALHEPTTWEALSGVDEVFDVHRSDNGELAGYSWRATAGPRSVAGTTTVESFEDRMVLMVDAGELAGKIAAELSPNGSSTELTVSVSLESRGTIASLFFPLISQVIGGGLPRQVDEFAARFESADR